MHKAAFLACKQVHGDGTKGLAPMTPSTCLVISVHLLVHSGMTNVALASDGRYTPLLLPE